MKRYAVETAGTKLGFTVEGTGAPLLVVGSSIYYPRTFSQRLKTFRTLICADLPHFVQPQPSFRPDSISFELYAGCIESIRAATGFDQVAIVGHSHHGNVAVEYAKRYPQRVSKIVLTPHLQRTAHAKWCCPASRHDLKPRVDRFALQRQHSEDAFVDSPQRLVPNKTFQRSP